jgi:8-oxo-dGTP pyrophosphatase MutT (NUDIX family)
MIDAAVLIPVYRDAAGDLRIVLILRNPGGVHGGQIGFPGGKRDPGDATPLDTALREAFEEIGLTPEEIEIIAELPVTETRTTGYRVFPFLARIAVPDRWCFAEREVAEVIDVRLADLVDSAAAGSDGAAAWDGPPAASRPFYRIGAHRLWGLSYRIFDPIIPRLLAGEWGV